MLKSTARSDLGRIEVSDEAIAEMASSAALGVDGVAGLGALGRVENLAAALGVDRTAKGVRVEMVGREVSLKVALMVDFGADVAEVGLAVQEAVASTVEQMTGLEVREVDVAIQGVRPPRRER